MGHRRNIMPVTCVDAPSLYGRALLSVALLLGFFLIVLDVAAILIAISPIASVMSDRAYLLMFV